jgi:hypothetical protein
MNLTDQMVDRIADTRHKIADLVARRNAIIKEDNLGARFSVPDANWHSDAANDYQRKYAALRDCSVEKVVEIIRSLSENYTGNQFLTPDKSEAWNLSERWISMNGKIRQYRDGRWVVDDEPKGSNQRSIPSRYLYRPLQIPGESGTIIDDVIINKDTCTYQGYLNLMIDEGIITNLEKQACPIIVEIGAGYGALALAFLQILRDNVLYVICDLPESLMFSGIYLTLSQRQCVACGSIQKRGPGILLVPNYWFHHLINALGGDVDLVLNTLSMSEMSEHQARTYAEGIAKLIGNRGMFFEHNHNNKGLGMIDCKDYFPEFFSSRKMLGNFGFCNLWSNQEKIDG